MKNGTNNYNKIIQKFIRHKNIPLWYKELSKQQIASANELLNNLRDDLQEGTTHRTKLNLQYLGISPLPKKFQINLAMQFSQGNDLAFLWFLAELIYCSRESLMNFNHKITVNQQILMSVIVHLDMCPTLRELDKLLPKPTKKMKVIETEKSLVKQKICYTSPYLEPLSIPISFKASRLKVKEFKPNFYPYDKYRDPNFMNQNEVNRWYTDLEKINIVVNRCDRILKTMEGNVSEDTTPRFLCTQFHDIDVLKQSIKNDLKASIQNRCEKFSYVKDDKQLNEFIQQIKNDLRCIEKKFNKLCDKIETRIKLPKVVNELLQRTITDTKDTKLCREILLCGMDQCIEFTKRNQNCKCKLAGKLSEIDMNLDARLSDHKKPKLNESSNKFEFIKTTVENALTIENYNGKGETIFDFNNKINKKCDGNTNESNPHTNLSKIKGSKINMKIDPNNNELMNKLLIAGIEEMKKNPKYVMVQLSEVYKLPVLQLWIRTRFGYTITEKQKKDALKVTKRILNQMSINKIKIPFPKASSICYSKRFSYLYKTATKKKADLLMSAYLNQLKLRLLEDTRIYWYCMESAHCNSDQLRDVFYSYLPAKPQDIFPFRPWGYNEFTDMKTEHEKRKYFNK